MTEPERKDAMYGNGKSLTPIDATNTDWQKNIEVQSVQVQENEMGYIVDIRLVSSKGTPANAPAEVLPAAVKQKVLDWLNATAVPATNTTATNQTSTPATSTTPASTPLTPVVTVVKSVLK